MDDVEAGAGPAQGGPPRSDDSLRAGVERLIVTGRELAEAEIAWARLKGNSLAAILRRGLLFSIIAMVGLMVGLSLLLVAGIVALAPLVGLLYATLIVIVIAFAIAILFGLLARKAFHALMSGDEP